MRPSLPSREEVDTHNSCCRYCFGSLLTATLAAPSSSAIEPQRIRIERDVCEAQILDRGIDPHAVAGGAEIGERRLDAAARVGGEGLQVDRCLLRHRVEEIWRHRLRRRAEGAFRFDVERHVGEPQHLRLAIEHRPAPDMDGRLGGEAEPAPLLARLHPHRDQQAIAGRRHARAAGR